MSKIKEIINEELEKVQEISSSGEQLTFDNFSILFLASIMEEEANEHSRKK